MKPYTPHQFYADLNFLATVRRAERDYPAITRKFDKGEIDYNIATINAQAATLEIVKPRLTVKGGGGVPTRNAKPGRITAVFSDTYQRVCDRVVEYKDQFIMDARREPEILADAVLAARHLEDPEWLSELDKAIGQSLETLLSEGDDERIRKIGLKQGVKLWGLDDEEFERVYLGPKPAGVDPGFPPTGR
ncbi:MAG: hypothetical protein KJ709_06965 [Nanoarchaeota archaeon]|nr:hypothetical protein [Nanoarchaeota archaeon]